MGLCRRANTHRHHELSSSDGSACLMVHQREPNGAVGQDRSARPRAPLIRAEGVDAASAQRQVGHER